MAEWAGLWHYDSRDRWRDELPSHLAIYLLAPLAIAVMFASSATRASSTGSSARIHAR